MSSTHEGLIREVENSLRGDQLVNDAMQRVLPKILDAFDCVVGTVHRFDEESRLLRLVAHKDVPRGLLARVTEIPLGKGMAGIAAERREPVQVCNLQNDRSGVAKPDAKLTSMQGSISLPILVNGELRGTLGVAKPVAYEFSANERQLLLEVGSVLGRYMSPSSR